MNKRKNNVYKFMIAFYTFLLIITGTFAWMSNTPVLGGRTADLVFTEENGNALQITSKQLSANLYIKNEESNSYELSNSVIVYSHHLYQIQQLTI